MFVAPAAASALTAALALFRVVSFVISVSVKFTEAELANDTTASEPLANAFMNCSAPNFAKLKRLSRVMLPDRSITIATLAVPQDVPKVTAWLAGGALTACVGAGIFHALSRREMVSQQER